MRVTSASGETAVPALSTTAPSTTTRPARTRACARLRVSARPRSTRSLSSRTPGMAQRDWRAVLEGPADPGGDPFGIEADRVP